MKFVSSPKKSKTEVKKIILSFYYSEKYTKQNDYCDYKLFKIWTFVNCVKSFLIYDVFEYLTDFLVSICFPNDASKCFDHIKLYDCLEYKNSRLIKLYSYDNIRSLLEVPKFYPLCIFRMFKKISQYRYKFHCLVGDKDFKYKCWIPRSGVKVIRREIKKDDPTTFDFSKNKVYIRVVDIREYNNNKYAVIECRLAK